MSASQGQAVLLLLVGTRAGNVLWERFWPFAPQQTRLAWHAALHETTAGACLSARDEAEQLALVGCACAAWHSPKLVPSTKLAAGLGRRDHSVVWIAAGDLVVFCGGHPGADELERKFPCFPRHAALQA